MSGKYPRIEYGAPVFHKTFGLGMVVMTSYPDEDWANIEFGNDVESVFKHDLVQSTDLIELVKSSKKAE